ncbi:MAG TPA: serine--tRNA ligase [Gammaproteobacteria bacterium]|jgi:seryl-tRNA synthetase|nr:serine--tRNA ligase [Gammaproteobacteria bacterium]
MLDPKLVRNSIDTVAAQLKKRGFVVDVAKYNELEERRKNLQIKMQDLQNERNVRSKEVGMAKASGKNVDDVLASLKELSDSLKVVEDECNVAQSEIDTFLSYFPNIVNDSVPEGKSEKDNVVVRTWGEPKKFTFKPKDHVELGAAEGRIDFETAAKLSGSRFVVLRGPMARLSRALAQFMLDLHTTEHGYQEISVPYIVSEECLYGTGQLPKFREDAFSLKCQGDHDSFLISTSEIPVTNTVRDSIVNASDLPVKYACYSACFRSEAGSYGKDIRGMLRLHQFEKVELVHIVKPEKSYEALEELVRHAETVLQKLELPYRVVTLCTADIGFGAAKTYDLEVWLPGQDAYREISSCSNMEAFQARRMKSRYRDESGKIDLVHTLNGSGLAIGRTLIAVVENYQDELGRIHIPKALQSYMGGLEVIE